MMLRGIKLDRTATGRHAFFHGCDGNYAEWLAFTGDASTQPSVHITVAHGDVTLLVVGRADTLEDALTRAEDAINDAAPNIHSTYLACLGRNPITDYSDQILACREIVSSGLRMEAAALDRRIKRSGANSIQCEGRHGRWRASAFVRIGNKSYLAKSESDGPLDAIVALFTEIHDYYTRNQGADE